LNSSIAAMNPLNPINVLRTLGKEKPHPSVYPGTCLKFMAVLAEMEQNSYSEFFFFIDDSL
jgi:hypothetical protein